VNRILHVLIGDLPTVGDVAIKTSALFLTAAILFRFTERRTLAEFAPFDWIAAVAAGAIVGRAATATDTAWLQATTPLRPDRRGFGGGAARTRTPRRRRYSSGHPRSQRGHLHSECRHGSKT
jgi:hypothetical protein